MRTSMSDIDIDVQVMLEQNVEPARIAKILNIPLDWVIGVQEHYDPEAEPDDYCPFATMNS